MIGELRSNQHGLALILLVGTLLLGSAVVFYTMTSVQVPEIERNRKTEEALTIAKNALISYAVGIRVSSGNAPPDRLGDLPCPDLNDDGLANDGNCGNSSGSTGQAARIGRLPWRTLGLNDLRDGAGERLWYAVSSNFKNNVRSTCTDPNYTRCLNSDTRGTITVRNSSGTIIHNAGNIDPISSGVVAVVFAPGAPLRRQDGIIQSRGCAGGAGCNAAGFCTNTTTPKCNPINFLDASSIEDNANFADGSSSNGFIQGLVRDENGAVIVNDRLALVTYQDIMPLLEKRVANEVLACLRIYASKNNGRYPWPSPASVVSGKFEGAIDTLFGRIPDQPLLQTQIGSASAATLGGACAKMPTLCMNTSWQSPCQLPTGAPTASWWNNWKHHVFYGLADAYKPAISYTQPSGSVVLGGISPTTGCPTCLSVNPPTSTSDKQVVVIVSGRRLQSLSGGQPRNNNTNRGNPANYLESGNETPPTFTQQNSNATFNDIVVYK